MPAGAIFMFSGQGSHYYSMGREFFATHPVFKDTMRSLDAMLQDMGSPSVLGELYRGDRSAADWFDDLRFTHPAIFMIEYALFEALRSDGVEPDMLLGASLGEFAAAAAAGALRTEDVARSIVQQVDLLRSTCPEGGMLAILDDVATFECEAALHESTELAAINYDRHFVVSGGTAEIARVKAWLDAGRVLSQKLPVAYPFHSRLMDVAAEPYRRAVGSLATREPAVPIVSCESADVIKTLEPAHFWRMVRSPIRFRDAIRTLERRSEGGWLYLDLGPSGTLANFVKHNLSRGSRSESIAVLSPFASRSSGLERVKQSYRARAGARGSTPSRQNEKMKAVIFPGQGSQSRGMGGSLFEELPEITAAADRILGYSIARLCREDPERQLDLTQFTQPALFVVSALMYLSMQRRGAARPAVLAGHSLGEYTALFAAGVFDFETGLRLVQMRASLMAQVKDGGMAAVVGLDELEVRAVLEKGGLDCIDIANHNGAKQFIVAGPRAIVADAQPLFMAAGAAVYMPLRVSGAFHSRYMAPAEQELAEYLSRIDLRPPEVPVIANVTGRPYERDKIASTLAAQLTRPVRWDLTMDLLLSQGDIEIEEVGPGTVLTKLLDKIRRAGLTRSASGVPGAAAPPRAPAAAEEQAPRPHVQDRGLSRGAVAGVRFSAGSLGSAAFRSAYGVKYAYVCGAMYRGIASGQLVIRAGRAGILAFFGAGGLELGRVEAAIREIKAELRAGEPYGMNLVHQPAQPAMEDSTVDLFLKYGVRRVEAAAFMQVTPALVRYRVKGLRRGADGAVERAHRIIAKVSRPEVVEAFMSPAPERIVRRLVEEGKITAEEAQLAGEVPIADDLCVEADSGGHTDQGNPLILLPTMLRIRDRLTEKQRYRFKVGVGAAGGIGTPEAAAAAFLMGADFVLTGSINQCTVEAGMSAPVKDMLEQINIQDTDYAPAGDMFELGAKVQVLKKGVFFAGRARKLHELFREHDSLDDIDAATRAQLEQRYFRKTFDEVYRDTREYFMRRDPREIEKAEQSPKHKMALVFRWYFAYSQRLAMEGQETNRVDFQVHCGPALGAFNQWVKGTPLERWRDRHVDEIAVRLMEATADYMNVRLAQLSAESES